MARKLKVFRTSVDGQHEVICAVTSIKSFNEALRGVGFNTSVHYLREYSSETFNQFDIETTMADPGEVFVRKISYGNEPYTKREKRK